MTLCHKIECRISVQSEHTIVLCNVYGSYWLMSILHQLKKWKTLYCCVLTILLCFVISDSDFRKYGVTFRVGVL